MPKMKTKSGAKKRFRLTGSGLVKAARAGKRHNMRKRRNDVLRAVNTHILFKSDGAVVRKYFLPYGA